MENEKISEIKTNIINWYNFKQNSSILQIGVENKEITNYLNKKANKLTIAYFEQEEKDMLNKETKSNSVYINELEKDELYDYVCLIGTLNIYNKGEKAYKKLKELIKIAKEHCNSNGTILLVIDNKYAMKYWTSIYANKNILCNEKFALSKTMIEEILDIENLKTRKFYYALPDYKLTNVIFTDEYLPNIENISRNFICAEDEFMSFNQTEAYQEIIKENEKLFPFFANSYFIEINKDNKIESKVKFVSYTNIRKEKYRIQTVIYEDKVEKTYISKSSKQHIDTIKRNIDIMNKTGIKTLDSYNEYKIESKYVKEKSYDQILMQYVKNEEESKLFEEIKKYRDYLYEKLEPINNSKTVFEKYNIEITKEQKEKMHFIKNGLWDLIFQNTFYINNELYFYDQEWYEENIPVEFIVYRAITYFGELHRYISKEKLLEKLNLLEMKEIFEKLDNSIQLEIRDEEMWNLHTKMKTGQTLFDLYNNLKIEFEQYKKKYNEEENKKLQEEITSLENYNKKMKESTSWKITKPIRAIAKYLKK